MCGDRECVLEAREWERGGVAKEKEEMGNEDKGLPSRTGPKGGNYDDVVLKTNS